MAKIAGLIEKNPETQVCSIAVDDYSVIADLPTTTRGGVGVLEGDPSFRYAIAMGSTCVCRRGSTVEKYILFSEGWIRDPSSSSGSGGVAPPSGTDMDIATDQEVKDIFKI